MEKKKYYNSHDWGIQSESRSKGVSFLKTFKFKTMNYYSYNVDEFYNNLEAISAILEVSKSGYIIIFDPIIGFKRYSIPGKNNKIKEVIGFIKDEKIDLNNYKISFTERILEIPTSFCGIVITTGKGDTVIEVLNNSSDICGLTSTGIDTKNVFNYWFYDFEESYVIPYEINKIKEECQYYKGYYEFIYGKLGDSKDVYYVYYSNDKEYLNIFNDASPVISKRFGKI